MTAGMAGTRRAAGAVRTKRRAASGVRPDDPPRNDAAPAQPHARQRVATTRATPPASTEDAAVQVAGERSGKLHWFVVMFLVGLVIPWIITIGPLRLSVYRLALLVAVIPCLLLWVRGAAGRVRLADIFVLAFSGWSVICLIVNHGIEDGLQPSGIQFIETAGPYFIARCFIRTPEQFRNMVRLMFWVVIALLPFALIELFTGLKPLLVIFGFVMRTIDVTMMDVRWGLRRVQGPFEHPLLYGVVCGSTLALNFLVLGYGQSWVKRWGATVLAGFTSLLALSSGPMGALVVQAALLVWNWALKAVAWRWKILLASVVALYLFITLYSGQSVPAFYISHAPLFDAWSAYYRLLIWEYGSATVAHHPIFGIGLNEYERPFWMAPSVDMFWLNNAIMFGLPGGILIAMTMVAGAFSGAIKRNISPMLYNYRAGYLIALVGLFVGGWGVHFWNGSYAYFLFVTGSGLWIADYADSVTQASKGRHARSPRLQRGQVSGRPSRQAPPTQGVAVTRRS